MLAEPARLKIMHTICDGERTVNDIVARTGLSQTSASRHLGLMHRHGLVERRRTANLVYYRVADETMPELCRAVCERIALTLQRRQPLRRRLLRLIPSAMRRAA
jgi:DNA-binding transcriptional ArsR family regulator